MPARAPASGVHTPADPVIGTGELPTRALTAPPRRAVLRLLAGLLPGLLARPAPAAEGPRDQGIGGTGARPPQPEGEGDRGIGGTGARDTGVFGIIRRFGSIVVNDLRIAYPHDVAVWVDDAPATAADLKLGQVVRVLARPAAVGGRGGRRGLTTARIDVLHEVVGPVEKVEVGQLVVLGQTVHLTGLAAPARAEATALGVGSWVAISGLRRGDGSVVASLVESREAGPARLAGPVQRGADGAPAIAGLRLPGLDPALVGARAVVTGAVEAGAFVLRGARAEGPLFRPRLARVSVEAYVARDGRELRLGAGPRVAETRFVAGRGVPERGELRAVVTSRPRPDGAYEVEALRPARSSTGPQGRPAGQDGGGSGKGPGEGPSGLGRGPGGVGGPRDPGAAGPRGLGAGGARPPAGPGVDGVRGGPGGFGARPDTRGLSIDTRVPGSGPGGVGPGGSGGPGGFGAPGGFGGPGGGFGGGGAPGGFGGPAGGPGFGGGGPGGPRR